ncbi:MAG: hypothetical protein GYB68_02425 [Chloroflexi bacterium]|nr:hypothetical protein [Chloroflexota bacterium]
MKIHRVILLGLLLSAGLLVACGSESSEATPDEHNDPVSSDDSNGPTDEREPGRVNNQLATVETLDILILESFPLQATARVSGYTSDGCTEVIDDHVFYDEETQTFDIQIYTARPEGEDLACTQVLMPFERSIGLDILGLSAGNYTVTAYDLSTSFNLPQDNVLEQGDGY